MNSYPNLITNSRFKNITRKRHGTQKVAAFFLLFLFALGISVKAGAASFSAQSSTITAESCLPANNSVDPGETNTVAFVIKNGSAGDLSNVKVSLVTGGKVIAVYTGTQTVGTIAKDATATVSFSFRADGPCGGQLTPTLHVTWGANDASAEDVSGSAFNRTLGAAVNTTQTFSNSASITINDFNAASDKLGRASLYPSPITVAGVPHTTGLTGQKVSKVTVTLNGVSHTFSQDVQVLLVGPQGQNVVLMNDAGGATTTTAPISNADLTFDDSASSLLPSGSQITTGTYKPTDYPGDGDGFPTPAPAGPYGTTLSAFTTTLASGDPNPNGDWKLYVIDDTAGDSGVISGGWSLSITTTQIVCCGAGQTWPFLKISNVSEVSEDLGANNGGAVPANPVPVANIQIGDIDKSSDGTTVNDTGANTLTVVATSSNEALVKSSNLVVGGTGANRTIQVKALEPNASGTSTITVTVTDTEGHVTSDSFTLKVNSVNDNPLMSAIRNQAANVGTATPPIPFTVSDVESAPETLLVTGSSDNQAVVPNQNIFFSGSGANRSVTIVPATSATSGEANITLTISDPNGGSSTQTFKVAFTTLAGHPTITPLSNAAVDEDKSLTIGFTVHSASSTSDSSLTLSGTSDNTTILPQSGITFGGSGSERTVTLTPASNQNGTVNVTITVSDPNDGSTSTAFVLTVNSINDKPTITSVPDQSINEGGATGTLTFTVGDVETAAGALTVTAASSDQGVIPNGAITLAGSGADRTVKIDLAGSDANGKATITLTVTDGNGGTASSSFLVDVNAVNDAPTVTTANGVALAANTSPTVLTVNEDSGEAATTFLVSGITPGPANESLQTLSVSASSGSPNILTVKSVTLPAGSSDATIVLKTVANAFGTAEITFTVQDNGGTALGGTDTTVRKFKVVVSPVNDPPTLADIPNQVTPKNKAISVPIDVNDVETPKSQMVMTAQSSNQALVKDANIVFDLGNTKVTIIPEPNQLGTVTITITATDKGQNNDNVDVKSVTRSFDLTIANIEAPTILITPSSGTIDEDTVASANITLTDNSDGSGLILTGSSDNVALVPNSNILFGGSGLNRSLAIVPAADQSGTARITVVVKDPEGLTAAATFNLTVNPVEDKPVLTFKGALVTGTVTTLEDTATADSSTDSKLLEFTVSDAETPASQLIVSATAANKTLVPDANIVIGGTGNTRTLKITPAADQNGSTTVTVSVTDSANQTVAQAFTLNVTAVNDAPTVTQPLDVPVNEDAGTQTITFTGISPGPSNEGQTIASITVNADVNTIIDITQPVLSGDSKSATMTFTPKANQSGTTKMTLTLTDTGDTSNGGKNSTTVKFNIIVNSVNDLPTIAIADANKNISIAQDTATGIIPISIGDVETPTEKLVLSGVSDNPALVPNSNIVFGGSFADRSVKITPAAGQFGIAHITITVTDTDGGSRSQVINLTVSPGQVPTIAPKPLPTQNLDVNSETPIIDITVKDAQTAAANLIVTAVSDNPALVPNSSLNIQFATDPNNPSHRMLIVRPAKDQIGTANITVTVRDSDGNTDTTTLQVNVTLPNTAPVISPKPLPSALITANGGSAGPINFTVTDKETASGFLTLSATSDNTAVIPVSNIVFGGSGANRTVTVTSAANAPESTVNITITVKDNGAPQLSDSTTLAVKVQGIFNNPPTISTIANQTTTTGKATSVINFTVSDSETPADQLTLSAASSNQTLVPNGSIFLGGSGNNRTVFIQPASGQNGTATITLTVTDAGGKSATSSFTLTVQPVGPPATPTITSIADQTAPKNQSTQPTTFTVADADTAADLLTVTATSSNQDLIDPAHIFINGTGATRSIYVTPNFNATGTATITVTVTDEGGRFSSTSFKVTIGSSVSNDFNGDGKPDIIFEDAGGFLAYWSMDRENQATANYFDPTTVGDPKWRVVGTGDFNNDGKPDLIFQHEDGSLAAWLMNGTKLVLAELLNPSTTGDAKWHVVAVGDLSGDGKPDLIFQHEDGTLAVWIMNGINVLSNQLLNPSNPGDINWRVVGSGQFNPDSKLDLVFQHTDGSLAVWYMNGINLISGQLTSPANPGDINWRVVGTSDLDIDGKTDLIFQHNVDKSLAAWFMNGIIQQRGVLLNPSSAGGTWRVVAPQ